MRAVVQQVSSAGVTIDGSETRAIGRGFVILLGVTDTDDTRTAALLAEKIAVLRVFEDDGGKLNRSLLDMGGAALVVSNFTLYADARKGRRPSFVKAARPEQADGLYQHFVRCLADAGVAEVKTGEFGADMLVDIKNDGPVTLILDSEELFLCKSNS